MAYQLFPLMHYVPGDTQAETRILLVSAPFSGKITDFYARLDAGTCKVVIKINNTPQTGTDMQATDTLAHQALTTHNTFAEGDSIELLIAQPTNATELYTQLNLQRL